MANAYVVFKSCRETVAVYVSNKGEPEDIYRAIKTIVDNKSCLVTLPPDVATKFTYQLLKQGVNCRFTQPDNNTDKFDYKYLFVVGGTLDEYWLSYYKNGKHLFNNKVSAFPAYLEKLQGEFNIDDATGRVVSFRYNAGSKPGQVRLVKVDKVESHLNDVLISGNDLEAALEEPMVSCYRCYYMSKIDGGNIYLVK